LVFICKRKIIFRIETNTLEGNREEGVTNQIDRRGKGKRAAVRGTQSNADKERERRK
jgi:hypothetical protein